MEMCGICLENVREKFKKICGKLINNSAGNVKLISLLGK